MTEAPRIEEILTPDDAVDVLEELLEAQTQSYILGLKLKLPQHIVDGIHNSYSEPRDRLLHILIAFMQQENPRPTWKVIVDALRSPALNLPYLAKKVEVAHNLAPTSTPTNTTADGPQVVTTLSTAATNTTADGPQVVTASSTAAANTTDDGPQDIAILSIQMNPEETSYQHIQKDIWQFEMRFHEIKNATRENLEKRTIAVKRVADALTSLSPDADNINQMFLGNKVNDLFHAADHYVLFGHMNSHWNYFNYPILDHLIQMFRLVEVNDEMETYKADLQRFRENTPLALFCQSQTKKLSTPHPDFLEVVAKFEWPENHEPVMLEKVEQFRQTYAHHYHLREFAMMLNEVRPGSFIVTWLIPECIVEKMKSNIPESILKEFFVVKLEIAGECIYSFQISSGTKIPLVSPKPPVPPLSIPRVSPSSSGHSSPVLRSPGATSQPALIKHPLSPSISSEYSSGFFSLGSSRSHSPEVLRQKHLPGAQHDYFSGRGGGRGQGRGNCITYKFLGDCEKHRRGECRFRHEFKLPNPCREYVPVPEGVSVGMIIGSGGCNMKQLRSIAECHVDVKKERVLIVTENQEKLRLLVAKLKLIMSQESVSGPSWCFIHPKGISGQHLYQFRPYGGRVPPRARTAGLTMYELCHITQEGVCGDEEEVVRRFAALSPNRAEDTSSGLRTSLREVHGDSHEGAEGLKWTQRIRIQLRPHENIKKSLLEGLKVLCEKKTQKSFVTRLDARFGKVTWGRFPVEAYSERYSIESLTDLLFAENSKHMNIFNTDVKAANAEHVRPGGQSPVHALEIFDVKMTAIGVRGEEGARMSVCLLVKKSDDGRTNLKVLMVKKNETKNVTFDTLNLHRQHDVRIGLHHFECVEDGDPLYAVVREMLRRISFPSRHKVRMQTKTARWSVHLIRHKKKLTYMVDDNFAITVSDISEHSFDVREGEDVEFDMRMENTHVEVELHNLAWQCAFGRDGGLSSDQSLALFIKKGAADTRCYDTIPYPWQPEIILRDFDTFWGHLDTLSDRLDGLK